MSKLSNIRNVTTFTVLMHIVTLGKVYTAYVSWVALLNSFKKLKKKKVIGPKAAIARMLLRNL